MKITIEQLKEWSACGDGQKWFMLRYPDGTAEYQDVLNALAEDDLPTYADWLMDAAGPDKGAIIELESIANCKNFFATGKIVIRNGIDVAGRLRAGMGISAGDGIKAGFGIEAGLGIEAGEGIEAGDGIDAGDGIKAGWGISAGDGIEAGLGIDAGDGIKAGWGIGAGTGIKAGEGIEAGDGIDAGEGIDAGWGISAGTGIKAGWGISAGTGIKAGTGIEAGDGFGVFAGLRIPLSEWGSYAQVIANSRPNNLISGSWVDVDHEADPIERHPDAVSGLSEKTLRPLGDWHEDDGDVLWWRIPVEEPPYCGSPLADDWPGCHTHWTPILVPDAPPGEVSAEAA